MVAFDSDCKNGTWTNPSGKIQSIIGITFVSKLNSRIICNCLSSVYAEGSRSRMLYGSCSILKRSRKYLDPETCNQAPQSFKPQRFGFQPFRPSERQITELGESSRRMVPPKREAMSLFKICKSMPPIAKSEDKLTSVTECGHFAAYGGEVGTCDTRSRKGTK